MMIRVFMYKNILVAVAHGGNANHLVELGIQLAKKNDAILTLCHIKNLQFMFPNYTTGTMYIPQDIVFYESNNGMEEVLQKYKSHALKKGVKKVDVVVTSSSTPALAITKVVAEKFGCDLILCGESSRKKRILNFFGNTTNEILKNANVDVLIVKKSKENK